VAKIKKDPTTGDPVDCSTVQNKIDALVKAYGELRPLYDKALQGCKDLDSAKSGDCAQAAKAALDAGKKLRKGALNDFYQAERGSPRVCSQTLSPFDNLNSETCARQINSGGKQVRFCSQFPLNDMKNALGNAEAEIKAVADEEARDIALATVGVIEDARKGLGSLASNLNQDNVILFKSAINAAIAEEAVASARCAVCGQACPEGEVPGPGPGDVTGGAGPGGGCGLEGQPPCN
jgi:hypothetical protein